MTPDEAAMVGRENACELLKTYQPLPGINGAIEQVAFLSSLISSLYSSSVDELNVNGQKILLALLVQVSADIKKLCGDRVDFQIMKVD